MKSRAEKAAFAAAFCVFALGVTWIGIELTDHHWFQYAVVIAVPFALWRAAPKRAVSVRPGPSGFQAAFEQARVGDGRPRSASWEAGHSGATELHRQHGCHPGRR